MSSLLSKILRTGLVTEPFTPLEADVERVLQAVETRTRRLLGRALAIREVDAGSCNGCEIEISGLTGPTYDASRFGIHFVASPRHADMLLVTGPVGRAMKEPLLRCYEAMAEPRMVIAVGTGAISGGLHRGGYAEANGVTDLLPVSSFIPGEPPHPWSILHGLLLAMGRETV